MNEQHPVPYEESSPPAPSYERGRIRQDDWYEAEEGGAGIGTYFLSLYRHKWLMIAATLAGIIAAVVTWNSIPVTTTYTAVGSMWIQGQAGTDRTSGPIEAEGLLPPASWLELLASFAVLEPVVLQERLYIQPVDPGDLALFENVALASGDIVPGQYVATRTAGGVELRRGETIVESRAPGRPIGSTIGIRWMPPADWHDSSVPSTTFNLSSVRNSAQRLRSQLGRSVDGSAFINVELTGPDPELVASVVNAVMERNVVLAEELKTQSLQEEYDTLKEQLQYAQEQLRQAEQELESYRITTVTLPSDQPIQAGLEMTRAPVFGEFFEMQMRREEIRQDRERLESVAAEIDAGGLRIIESLELIPAVAESSQLSAALSALVSARIERRTLLEQYTEEHPSVRAVDDRIAGIERQEIPRLLSQLVQQLQVEDEVLTGRIASAGSELSQIPTRTIQEAQLNRRAQRAADFYGNLQSRFQIASLARASAVPDVSILDRAVPPEQPEGDDPRLPFALAAFGLLVLAGAAIAILWDYFDPRLRTPGEVVETFGLNLLGVVPRIERSKARRSESAIKNLGQMQEAFRELRTNLTFAYGAGPVVATISSSGMAEGKTTITTNLAVSFAELGRRTLLIDADTRRGDMHHYLNGHRKPGLTDFLRGRAELDDVLQSTPHENLEFIGSGTQLANSPELLSSSRMGDLMAVARKQYDVILVDSPPLGAGADTLVLATISGHLVLVVRSGTTNREFTLAKMEPVSRLPVRQLGVVVNEWEPNRLEGYQYHSTYLPGYESGAEEDVAGLSDDRGDPASSHEGYADRQVGAGWERG